MSIEELTANLDASTIKVAELAALNSEFEKENISLKLPTLKRQAEN